MHCSAIAGLVAVFIVPAHALADTTGRATIIDGDSIEIRDAPVTGES